MSFFQNNFIPYSNVIIAITNSNPAVVMTLTDHGYADGLYVRIRVPLNCGMQQMQGKEGQITVLAANLFSIPVDASNFDAFGYTSSDQVAQVLPVGENALSLAQAERNAKNITPEF